MRGFCPTVRQIAHRSYNYNIPVIRATERRVVLADLLVDVTELRVPVRVPLSLDGLGVALQAEPLGLQQIATVYAETL